MLAPHPVNADIDTIRIVAASCPVDLLEYSSEVGHSAPFEAVDSNRNRTFS